MFSLYLKDMVDLVGLMGLVRFVPTLAISEYFLAILTVFSIGSMVIDDHKEFDDP